MNSEEKWQEAERLTREYCNAIKDLGSSFMVSAAYGDTEDQLVSARAVHISDFADFQQLIYIQLQMLMDMTEITEDDVADFLKSLSSVIRNSATDEETEAVEEVVVEEAAAPEEQNDDAPQLRATDRIALQFYNDMQELGPQHSGVLAVTGESESQDPSLVSTAISLSSLNALRQLIAGLVGSAASANNWDLEDVIHLLADVRFMTAKWLGKHLDSSPDDEV